MLCWNKLRRRLISSTGHSSDALLNEFSVIFLRSFCDLFESEAPIIQFEHLIRFEKFKLSMFHAESVTCKFMNVREPLPAIGRATSPDWRSGPLEDLEQRVLFGMPASAILRLQIFR